MVLLYCSTLYKFIVNDSANGTAFNGRHFSASAVCSIQHTVEKPLCEKIIFYTDNYHDYYAMMRCERWTFSWTLNSIHTFIYQMLDSIHFHFHFSRLRIILIFSLLLFHSFLFYPLTAIARQISPFRIDFVNIYGNVGRFTIKYLMNCRLYLWSGHLAMNACIIFLCRLSIDV